MNIMILDKTYFKAVNPEYLTFFSELIYLPDRGKRFRLIKSIFHNFINPLGLQSNSRLFFYSPGDWFFNLRMKKFCKLSIELVMCEDGIAPYYFINGDLNSYYSRSTTLGMYISKWRWIILMLSLLGFDVLLDFQNNISCMLLNKKIDFYHIGRSEYLATSEFPSNVSIEAIRNFLGFSKVVLNNDVKYVFFASGIYEVDIKAIEFFKSSCRPGEFFVCYRKGDTSEKFWNNNFDSPWEVIFSHNRQRFMHSILISHTLSTIFLDTILNEVYFLNKYLVKLDHFKNYDLSYLEPFISSFNALPNIGKIYLVNSIEEIPMV